jgi:hypothetical protein
MAEHGMCRNAASFIGAGREEELSEAVSTAGPSFPFPKSNRSLPFRNDESQKVKPLILHLVQQITDHIRELKCQGFNREKLVRN